MSTPPGPPDDEGPGTGDDWDAPPPPPQRPQQPQQPPGGAWGQPGQGWDRPTPQWGQPAQPAQGGEPWTQSGTPGYGAPQTNGLAIGGLVASIIGFFTCGVGFIVGLILGYNARSQIRASAGQQTGEGLATGAIVVGWIGVGLTALAILSFVFLLMVGATAGGL